MQKARRREKISTTGICVRIGLRVIRIYSINVACIYNTCCTTKFCNHCRYSISSMTRFRTAHDSYFARRSHIGTIFRFYGNCVKSYIAQCY